MFNKLTTLTAGMMSNKMDYTSLGILGMGFNTPDIKTQ